ncbi:hypothetical protein GCM10010464_88930 [Pseudonocardia yunnanensis]|uniref:DUF3224 domain-containing protein n=1 Tax=Pseudonocardia yunnanensis TaxID=58107 RepID=A0ABW4FCP4_9PSEU
MRRQILLLRFETQTTPRAGDPSSLTVQSGPGSITLLEGDDSWVPTEASYETRVTITGETTFVEEGEIVFNGAGLRLTTVGAGVIEPSAEEGTSRGAVNWQVEGTGRLSGATGLVSANFEFEPERGSAVDYHIVRLFLP